MIYRVLADLLLTAHLAFVLFTLLGGVFVLRWRFVWPVHLAAVCWGVVLQWANWTCPLTPVESYMREAGGEAGYRGGFIEHYISLILYSEHQTIELRYLLGAVLIGVNLLVYGYVLLRKRRAA